MPTIGLNGSSAESLREDYVAAYLAVSDALRVVQEKACPNGRDYCQHGDDAAFPKARAEHQARLEVLDKVKKELEAIAMHCDANCKS